MKCPHCGKNIDEPGRVIPDTIYIEVREKKIGFTGLLEKGQLRHFGSLNAVYENLEGIVQSHHLVPEGIIYECRKLGTRGELKEKGKKS